MRQVVPFCVPQRYTAVSFPRYYNEYFGETRDFSICDEDDVRTREVIYYREPPYVETESCVFSARGFSKRTTSR